MPPKPSNLASFRSAAKLKNKAATVSSTATAASTSSSAAPGATVNRFLSSIDFSTSETVCQKLRYFKSPNPKSASSSYLQASGDASVGNLELRSSEEFEESPRKIIGEMSSILYDDSDVDAEDSLSDKDSALGEFFIPWLLKDPNKTAMRRKEISRERKQKWIFKSGQEGRVNWLMNLCKKFGMDATKQMLDNCKTQSGPEELNSFVKFCVQTARETDDEEVISRQIVQAYKVFELMMERGFQIKEEIYGPFLLYLVESGMVREFQFFCEFLKDGSSHQRLAYYEMLLWIRLNNEDKIQELCYDLSLYDGEDKSAFQENYLLAFCESGRMTEALKLLQTFDIAKGSSDEGILSIFRFLGKHTLESFAESFLVSLKLNDTGPVWISKFIFYFVTNIPNLTVEDILLKCRNLHTMLDVKPSSKHHEMLIHLCCQSFQVRVALDVVDNMVEAGYSLSLPTLHFMLDACAESCEYSLVHRIYSMMSQHGLKPNGETFRIMINLSVKMKDFNGAYRVIADLEKMNMKPTAVMYNVILAGFFREKNHQEAFRVLRKMEEADVKPDSQTYSYLLINCTSEEDINKIFDEMKYSAVQATKHVYMALINAYVACGEFEKAKQVIVGKDVPHKNLNELKSVLVSALASNGQMSDALTIYEEMKQAKMNLEPKSVICLIEHLQTTGELSALIQLLEELSDPDYWLDGCFRVISYCVHHEHLRPVVDLCKQLKDKARIDEVAAEDLFDGVFCQIAEKDSLEMHFGMNLLQAIKEELGVRPSRKCLDFLLTACIRAKDLSTCSLVWKEYEAAGLPYNVLSYVRMYQALLALGDHKSAKNILKEIPKNDPHVSCVISVSEEIYKTTPSKGKKKKKKVKGKL